jgi:hypothetical protein
MRRRDRVSHRVDCRTERKQIGRPCACRGSILAVGCRLYKVVRSLRILLHGLEEARRVTLVVLPQSLSIATRLLWLVGGTRLAFEILRIRRGTCCARGHSLATSAQSHGRHQ